MRAEKKQWNMPFPAILALLILCMPVQAQDLVLLEEPDLPEITARIAESGPGCISLELKVHNEAQEDVELSLFDPLVNGQMASFDNGWGLMDITAAPGESDLPVQIFTDDPQEIPESFAMRFVSQEKISTLCTVQMEPEEAQTEPEEAQTEPEGAQTEPEEAQTEPEELQTELEELQVEPAEFLPAEDPRSLVTGEVEIPEKRTIRYKVYTDKLEADRAALLDYGQMVVLLRDPGSGLYRQVSTCELKCEADGRMKGSYSGLVLLEGWKGGGPIETIEEMGKRIITTKDGLMLTGPEVFFARLNLTVDLTGEEPLVRPRIFSDEFGGTCSAVPFDLFAQVQTGCVLWELQGDDAEHASLVKGAVQTQDFPVNAQLSFRMCPIEELGESIICFEYYFKDGSSLLRMQ